MRAALGAHHGGREEKSPPYGCWEQARGVLSSPGKLPTSPGPKCAPSPAIPTKKAGAQAKEQGQKPAFTPGSQPHERGHCDTRNHRAGAVSTEQGGAQHSPAPPGHVFGAFPKPGGGRAGNPAAPKASEGLAAGPRLGAAPSARALARLPLGIFIPGICLGGSCLLFSSYFFFFFHGPPLFHPGLEVTAIAARPAAVARAQKAPVSCPKVAPGGPKCESHAQQSPQSPRSGAFGGLRAGRSHKCNHFSHLPFFIPQLIKDGESQAPTRAPSGPFCFVLKVCPGHKASRAPGEGW